MEQFKHKSGPKVIDQFFLRLTERLVILTINYIMKKHHNQQKIKDTIDLNGREHFKHRGRKKNPSVEEVVV